MVVLIKTDQGDFEIADFDGLIEFLKSKEFEAHVQRNHFNAETLYRLLHDIIEAAHEVTQESNSEDVKSESV
jgi:hypothetical protein